MTEPARLVVVGGGVAGLAGAREAIRAASERDLPLEVTLLEASDRFGGKVRTEQTDDGFIEWGPDSFLAAKPEAAELCRELGIALVAPAASRAYLWLGGRLRPLPEGVALGVPTSPGALVEAVRTGVLSPAGALRAALEPVMGRLPAEDVSAGDVFRRRLGPQATERLVAPLLGGVYGAHPDELGLATILPQLAGARSLTSVMRRRSTPTGPTFLAPQEGTEALVRGLLAELGDAELRTRVAAKRVAPGGVETAVGTITADAVLLALPAPDASTLVADLAPPAADALAAIRFSSSAVVHLAFPRGSTSPPADASGYLAVDASGGRPGAVAACTFLEQKWPHYGYAHDRLRAVVTDPDALTSDDDALAARSAAEVRVAANATAGPVEVRVHRWGRALPVYAPGHRERIAEAVAALPAHVRFAGASIEGVGLPDCIRTGRRAARELVEGLSARAPVD